MLNINLTYRTRRRLRRLGIVSGSLLLAAVVIFACWFVWLERFVVYTSDGVRLDFDYTSPGGTAQVAEPPTNETVAIHYNEGDETINASLELTQIQGYYVTTDMFTASVDNVRSTIQQLPAGSAVMLDLKSPQGKFFYTSGLSNAPISTGLDVTQVDQLIKDLDSTNIYLIARVPAFRDMAYGLENTTCGLAHSSGKYLWSDELGCYWLNPTSSGALNWLITIANELKGLGFDEVVFTEFCFPATTQIIFDSNMTQQEALEAAAETLVTSCATSRFAVSFESTNASFRIPEGRSRLYLAGVEAAQAADVAGTTTVADKAINLVMLTETNDTRFDAFSVMRPMPVPN